MEIDGNDSTTLIRLLLKALTVGQTRPTIKRYQMLPVTIQMVF